VRVRDCRTRASTGCVMRRSRWRDFA
jgi:hypothetical protein